jgi:hypothetical protein
MHSRVDAIHTTVTCAWAVPKTPTTLAIPCGADLRAPPRHGGSPTPSQDTFFPIFSRTAEWNAVRQGHYHESQTRRGHGTESNPHCLRIMSSLSANVCGVGREESWCSLNSVGDLGVAVPELKVSHCNDMIDRAHHDSCHTASPWSVLVKAWRNFTSLPTSGHNRKRRGHGQWQPREGEGRSEGVGVGGLASRTSNTGALWMFLSLNCLYAARGLSEDLTVITPPFGRGTSFTNDFDSK